MPPPPPPTAGGGGGGGAYGRGGGVPGAWPSGGGGGGGGLSPRVSRLLPLLLVRRGGGGGNDGGGGAHVGSVKSSGGSAGGSPGGVDGNGLLPTRSGTVCIRGGGDGGAASGSGIAGRTKSSPSGPASTSDILSRYFCSALAARSCLLCLRSACGAAAICDSGGYGGGFAGGCFALRPNDAARLVSGRPPPAGGTGLLVCTGNFAPAANSAAVSRLTGEGGAAGTVVGAAAGAAVIVAAAADFLGLLPKEKLLLILRPTLGLLAMLEGAGAGACAAGAGAGAELLSARTASFFLSFPKERVRRSMEKAKEQGKCGRRFDREGAREGHVTRFVV